MGSGKQLWRVWLMGIAATSIASSLAMAQVAAPEKAKTEKLKTEQPVAKAGEKKPAEKKPAEDEVRVPLKDSSTYLQPFKAAVALASKATVTIIAEGKVICLGTIVSAEGYILTKASELKGSVVCKLRDGRTFAAELVGIEDQNDLALLKIPTKGLPTIQWADSSSAQVGNWVCTATNSDEPVAVGVVSVATRENKAGRSRNPSSASGFLGVTLEPSEKGPVISMVEKDSSAAKAGVVKGDVVLEVKGKKVVTPEQMIDLLQTTKPGDIVKLKFLHKEGEGEAREKVVDATLNKRPSQNARGDIQNSMGGKLSQRRTAFPKILQHDTTLAPESCGGPLVDLEGKAVGLNIARAGRVETYALPSEIVKNLVPDLIAGKFKVDASVTRQASLEQRMEMAKTELKKAEEGVTAGRTKRNEARVAYQGAKLDVDNPSAAKQLKRRLDQADLELKAAQEQLNKAKEDLKGLEEAKKSKEKVEMR